jgi:hypothetical protein
MGRFDQGVGLAEVVLTVEALPVAAAAVAALPAMTPVPTRARPIVTNPARPVTALRTPKG